MSMFTDGSIARRVIKKAKIDTTILNSEIIFKIDSDSDNKIIWDWLNDKSSYINHKIKKMADSLLLKFDANTSSVCSSWKEKYLDSNKEEKFKFDPRYDDNALLKIIFGKDSEILKKFNKWVFNMEFIAVNGNKILHYYSPDNFVQKTYYNKFPKVIDMSLESDINFLKSVAIGMRDKNGYNDISNYSKIFKDSDYVLENLMTFWRFITKFREIISIKAIRTAGNPFEKNNKESISKRNKWFVVQPAPNLEYIIITDSTSADIRGVFSFEDFNKFMINHYESVFELSDKSTNYQDAYYRLPDWFLREKFDSLMFKEFLKSKAKNFYGIGDLDEDDYEVAKIMKLKDQKQKQKRHKPHCHK